MISARLKNLIFDYILKDLYNVEIIYYRDSIWFIDRENRYWYFEYHKVDKHLWWRWSRFTSALNMFSMEAEEKQYLFGDLVNMILTKKQKLESKYPNKIFKTVGSVMNFEDNDEVKPKNEVKTTSNRWHGARLQVDEVLNYEVKTTADYSHCSRPVVDEVLNSEVETTEPVSGVPVGMLDKVLNNEVKTTDWQNGKLHPEVDEVLNCEVKTTSSLPEYRIYRVDEVLNCEVKTTDLEDEELIDEVDEVLNYEVETTHSDVCGKSNLVDDALNYESKTIVSAEGSVAGRMYEVLNYEAETITPTSIVTLRLVDEVLNYEVETTSEGHWPNQYTVDEALNCEVKTTQCSESNYRLMVDEVLNYDVEKTDGVFYNDEIVTNEVLNYDVEKIYGHRSPQDILVKNVLEFSIETTKSGELIEEDKIMDDVLEIQNIQPTERGVNDMVDFVLEVEDYVAWDGKQNFKVNEALENTIEINSIEKLKGENPFQDIVVGHILDESDKVTDKLVIKEEEYVKTYSHDVYMCDHLVQNVLDVGVNSIHYDAEPHTQLVDGILKKA